MALCRRRQALFFAGLLLFLAFFSLALAAIWSVPPELRLLPGETGRLRVGFPLSLLATERVRPLLVAPLSRGREFVFCSAVTGTGEVELTLFGAIPVRRLAVKIVPERRVIPGGQAIGVLLAAGGVVVVGHQPLQGLDGLRRYPAREAGVQIGDVILTADDVMVNNAEELARLVGHAARAQRRIRLSIRRAGHSLSCRMEPVLCTWPPEGPAQEPRAMLGLFVEDPAAGVGTLTFYDPVTSVFAALGHRITELGGQRNVWLEGGKIVAARIAGIEQGQRGSPGEKIGTFSGPGDIIGTIAENTHYGLFGMLEILPAARSTLPVALAHQVHPGSAEMLTVVQGTEVQAFSVEIVRVYQQDHPHEKGMVIKVTDPRLLGLTGGIVQGMSGSPIIQDGRLAGAITHVLVNDPTRGYGVLAEWMIRAMDALAVVKAA